MKASELRIGNLILLGDKVIIVNLDVLNRIGKRYYDTYPIPLTKEWLLKFGFELFPWGWVKDEILIRHIQYKKFWIELGNGKRIYFPHIHTLQNFFALTGKELES